MFLTEESNRLTFEIICSILFGREFKGKVPPVQYVDRDGRTSQLDFYEHMMKLNRDCSFDGLSPMNVVFPVLVHLNIGTRNRINTRNNDAWIRALT